MRALEIRIVAFDHNDKVYFEENIYTIMREVDLTREVVAMLYTKATNKSINPERFIWSVRKRINITNIP